MSSSGIFAWNGFTPKLPIYVMKSHDFLSLYVGLELPVLWTAVRPVPSKVWTRTKVQERQMHPNPAGRVIRNIIKSTVWNVPITVRKMSENLLNAIVKRRAISRARAFPHMGAMRPCSQNLLFFRNLTHMGDGSSRSDNSPFGLALLYICPGLMLNCDILASSNFTSITVIHNLKEVAKV